MSGEPSLRRKVVVGLVWSAIRHWGSRLIGLVTFVVLARFVQPHEVGLIAAAMAVMAFVEIFTEQGVQSAIVQRPTVSAPLLNAAFAFNLALAVALTAGVAIAAPWIAAAMKVPEVTGVIRFVSLTLVFGALGFTQEAMYKRHFDYRWLALRTLVATAVSGAVGVAMVVAGLGVWGLATQVVLAVLVSTVLMWVRPQWRLSFEFDFAALRGLLCYSFNVFGSKLLFYGNTRFFDVFLAASLGPALLGIYAVGAKVYSVVMQLVIGATMEVAHGGFSRLAAERERLIAAFYDASAASAAIAVPLFVLTAVAAPEVVEVLFGARWGDSVVVMVPMALFGSIQVLQWYAGSMNNAIGRPELTLLANSAKFVATVVSLLLTRGKPLETVVWVYVAGQLCIAPLELGLSRWKVGWSIRRYLGRLAPFLLGYAAMVATALALRAWPPFGAWPAFVRLAAMALLAVVAYTAVCAALAHGELRRLRGHLRRD